MKHETIAQLVDDVQQLLDQGLSICEAARELGFNSEQTLYHRLYRNGYRIGRKVVPIHAPALNQESAA